LESAFDADPPPPPISLIAEALVLVPTAAFEFCDVAVSWLVFVVGCVMVG
jgi:hypothetical protein